jgi:FKBP-type peptidyl-prolyl cis-trans isomerase
VFVSTVLLMFGACSGTSQDTTTPAETEAAGKPGPKEIPPPEDVAAPSRGAKKTDSGISYKPLAEGTGTESPGELSRVTLKFTSWTTDGKMVESTEQRSRLSNFAVRDAPLPFLKEVLPTLKQGSKMRYWVPAELAYKGQPGKPEGAVTVDLELTGIVNPPPAPDDVAKPAADAQKTASGLAYKVLKEGPTPPAGSTAPPPESPSKWAKVTLNYTGWGADGKVIDSTVTNGRPQMVVLSERTVPGFVEGIQLMKKGQKVRMWIPEPLTNAAANNLPAGMLTYDVELMSFDNPVPPPDDVAAPPADAKRTASGLAYKVIKKGTTKKPQASSIVEMNYTGWSTDGRMIDTTTKRKKPARMAVSQAMAGWAEGLQLMGTGEVTRFWIPAELAYKDQPGKPQGMLVYELELVSVIPGPVTPPDLKSPAAGGRKSPSGVVVNTLKAGTGKDHPQDGAKVELQYSGWTAADGKMFDSTFVRGEPAKFPLSGAVPKGLVEGIQQMVKGEKARLWIPEELAASQRPGSPKGMLVFDVELLGFENPPPPIPAPPDVAAPPADAQKTASGLAYKVLTKGTGTAKPATTSRVKVNYTGWTTDGKMFDSSVQRGQPAEFPLSGVIKGWTEGLQLMVVGETTRFWIPVELAYNNKPGRPAGMLVFDVELLEIKEGGPTPPPGMQIRPKPEGLPAGHP